MKLEHPFVKICPRCDAPVAFWEIEAGQMPTHFRDLHETRLIDLSLGRSAREHLSDRWDGDRHVWVKSDHWLRG